MVHAPSHTFSRSFSPYSRPSYSIPRFSQAVIGGPRYGVVRGPSMPVYTPPVDASPRRFSPAVGTTIAQPARVSVPAEPVAWLDVRVPSDAVIHLNGRKTNSTGESRRYRLTEIEPGKAVTCQVRAEVIRESRTIRQTRRVLVHAGSRSVLAFDMMEAETSLTIRVPSDAKVYLANNEKEGAGEVRVFRTNKLDEGQKVSDYPVRVSVVRGGRVISKERTISLASGDSRYLVFEFDESTSAASLR